MKALRLVVKLDADGLSPRGLREAFADAVRAAIMRAREQRLFDNAVTEELLRVLPAPGNA